MDLADPGWAADLLGGSAGSSGIARPPLPAMGRDYRLLLSIRLLRSFGFGFVPVLLGLHFEERGLSAGQLGAALAVGVLAAALSGCRSPPWRQDAGAGRSGHRPAHGAHRGGPGPGDPAVLLVLARRHIVTGASSADLSPFWRSSRRPWSIRSPTSVATAPSVLLLAYGWPRRGGRWSWSLRSARTRLASKRCSCSSRYFRS